MRKRPAALILSLFLLTSFASAQTAPETTLRTLLDLPAPPPTNETQETTSGLTSYEISEEETNDESKVPPDDAPIGQLLMFWPKHNFKTDNRFRLKPSETVVRRLFAEIKRNPSLLPLLFNLLPPEKEYVDFIRAEHERLLAEFRQNLAREQEMNERTYRTVEEAAAAADQAAAAAGISGGASSGYEAFSTNSFIVSLLGEWLMYNSDAFSDQLLRKALKIEGNENSLDNRRELIALARVDFEKAEPLLERLIAAGSPPAGRTLAMWAYYAHYLHEDDERSAARYRRMLQDVVEDRKADDPVRDLALWAVLAEDEFEGLDEWLISLFEDDSLLDLGIDSGLKSLILRLPVEKWTDRLLELVGHRNPSVHNVAVRNLLVLLSRREGVPDEKRKTILKALLPWLSDPDWAKIPGNERIELINLYGNAVLPESVPALMTIIRNERPAPALPADDNETPVPEPAPPPPPSEYPLISGATRLAAIKAVASYKDPRTIPLMQAVLAETENRYIQGQIVSALIEAGGITPREQAAYLESFIRKMAAEGDPEFPFDGWFDDNEDELTMAEMVVEDLVTDEDPDEEVVRLVVDRSRFLSRTEPEIAEALRSIMRKWDSVVIDVERLDSLAAGTADPETIVTVLAEREPLRKSHRDRITAMLGSGGLGAGIAACLLEDPGQVLGVVSGRDVGAAVAALACARLLRISLPVSNVVPLMYDRRRPLLALAAERYLEAEDSREARRAILAKYPGEARILGATSEFFSGGSTTVDTDKLPLNQLFSSLDSPIHYSPLPTDELDKIEDKLRGEVRTDPSLKGIYAFLQNETAGHQILRIYEDRAVYTWHENESRFRERTVAPKDLEIIFRYVAAHRIEELKPVLEDCGYDDCTLEEFVLLGPSGGRRVFVNSSTNYAQPLYGLRMIFDTLKQGESRLRYKLEESLEGLEVILDSKDLKVRSLWKNGSDFRVLVFDENKEKEINEAAAERIGAAREAIMNDPDAEEESYIRFGRILKEINREGIAREYEPYEWRMVADGKLGAAASPPEGDLSIRPNGEFPAHEDLDDPLSRRKATGGGFEFRKGDGVTQKGLFRVAQDGLVSQITDDEDFTENLVVSTDGRWILAAKMEDHYFVNLAYRVDTRTGKAFKVELPRTFNAAPVAYLPEHGRFLVRSDGSEVFALMPESFRRALKDKYDLKMLIEKKTEYFLVDPKTGSHRIVTGEFRPLEQISFRDLQRTDAGDSYWAAIPDERTGETSVGRYDAKKFVFREEMRIPGIRLTSMDIWVDETESKLYFIYEGHLLALPLMTGSSSKERKQ